MKQKIIRIGNSGGVTISKSLMEESGVKIGTHVDLSYKADMGRFIIDLPQKKTVKTGVSDEFQKWLSTFLEEDKDLLDDLAQR